MNLIRSLVFVVWLYVTMALVAIVFFPAILINRKAAQPAMTAWGWLTRFGLFVFCGVRVRIEGREHIPQGASLVAMKHQSMFDTLIPGQTLKDACIVYKAELNKTPFMGYYLQRGEMIPVARETHASALKTMLRAARVAREKNREIFIFPEGTRQWPGSPPDYKPGVAALYRDMNLPCTPVATNSGVHWPPKGIARKPGLIVVRFLPPIPPGLPREEFMRELESRIETESAALLPPDFKPAPQAIPAAA